MILFVLFYCQAGAIAGVHVRKLALKSPEAKLALRFLDTESRDPSGFALSSDCAVMAVAYWLNGKVALYSALDGSHLGEFGGRGKGPGQFNTPQGVCFSPFQSLFVADYGNYRIQVCAAASHP